MIRAWSTSSTSSPTAWAAGSPPRTWMLWGPRSAGKTSTSAIPAGRAPVPVMDLLDLARAHQLDLEPASLNIIEMGLDFRVVVATDTTGRDWVLRIPRYPSVMDRAAAEARVL